MRSPHYEPAPRLAALKNWVESVLPEAIESWAAMPAAASARKFYRVTTATGTVVAMDAPPPEDNAGFVRLAALFSAAGVAVPSVLNADLEAGFLLVSDLGERHLADVYGTSEQDLAIEAALATLVAIQSMPAADLPPYDSALCRTELDIFRQWLLGALLDIKPPAMMDDVFAALIDNAASQPHLPMHRDYHCNNLLWAGDATLRVVDFQGALIGPVSYDLCSLLRDCYWRFSEAEVQRWRTRYLAMAAEAGIGVFDDTSFSRWLDWMALQRQLKALGIFVRLKLRDGRNTHVADIPLVLEHAVDITEQYAELKPFGQWLANVLQPALETHPDLHP